MLFFFLVLSYLSVLPCPPGEDETVEEEEGEVQKENQKEE